MEFKLGVYISGGPHKNCHSQQYVFHHPHWLWNKSPRSEGRPLGSIDWQHTVDQHHPPQLLHMNWNYSHLNNRTSCAQWTSHVLQAAWMCRADSPGSNVLSQMRAWWSWSSWHSAVSRLSAAVGIDTREEDASRRHRWPTGDCQETGSVQLHWPWCLVDTGQHQLAGSPGVWWAWTHSQPSGRFGVSWWRSHRCWLVGRSPTVPDRRSGCKPIWDLFYVCFCNKYEYH